MGFNDRRGGRFGRDRHGGDRGGFGGRGGGFGDRRRSLEMHDATCTKCNKQCQVPFKPTGDKPVLCSDCFRNESPRRDRFSSSSGASGSSGISQEQVRQINSKLDKILGILDKIEFEDEDEDDEEIVDDISDDESEDIKPVDEDEDEDESDDELDENSDDKKVSY